ncbi:MAG: alpha-N-arabinofuranosidase [Clostridiales bacterium]|nr:alpha-N-arabinofuranosidase [Clostridiales bacterium]
MYKLIIDPHKELGHIQPEIQGHFSEHLGRCIYGGVFVGEKSEIPNVNGMRKDVVEALKEIRIPVLRWPGGCFADEYHWKDGIGDKSQRKKMINTNWGGVVEDNSFGTHEYMELCRQLGCKTYVNGNVGSGTVQEMSEWVEYMTFDGVSPMAELRKKNGSADPWRVNYFGIGNENWGCGGNMLPEYYANLFRRYQSYVKIYDPEKPIKKIACGPNAQDYEWTETVLQQCHKLSGSWNNAHGFMDGISLHYYTLPYDWAKKGAATGFNLNEWYMTLSKTLFMEELVSKHSEIIDRFDPDHNIGLIVDEWGTWYDVEEGTNPGFLYQQNTMRDALVASINLNIFNKHCDRVKMANIAQLVNVLQSVLLTEGDQMIKTPTYFVFDMYKYHQDATLIKSSVETTTIGKEEEFMVPNLHESCSKDKDGKYHITISNLSAEESYEVCACMQENKIESAKAEILTGKMDDKNTFEEPDRIKKTDFDSLSIEGDSIRFTIPQNSVMHIEVSLG